jgi:hypothetical protein
MSVHAVEKALWDVCNNPESHASYRANAADFVHRYPLSDAEKHMVSGLEVEALTAHQVNPMLIMMTWNAIVGADKIGEYLGRLNTPQPAVQA